MHKNSLSNLTYRIPKGSIPWNKGRKGDILGTRKDITGKKFGKLTAVRMESRIVRNNGGFRYKWLFLCECGKQTITDRDHVTQGHTTSCGCHLKELHDSMGERFTTHGLSKTRFWQTFRNIEIRCTKPSGNRWHIYGGRGIKCLWNTFEEFRDDMYESYLQHVKEFGEKNTSIDRIDNDGHYCKENCRWATVKEQMNNKRGNRLITFQGETLNLTQWAEKTGIGEATIRVRIDKLKWPIEKALTLDIRNHI